MNQDFFSRLVMGNGFFGEYGILPNKKEAAFNFKNL